MQGETLIVYLRLPTFSLQSSGWIDWSSGTLSMLSLNGAVDHVVLVAVVSLLIAVNAMGVCGLSGAIRWVPRHRPAEAVIWRPCASSPVRTF